MDTKLAADQDAGNSSTVTQVITDEEKALYDRQIRLWGIDAQNRLRNSTVLLAGLTGCGCEVAKNLMLVGVKSLTLLDHQLVDQDDQCAQFLISAENVGENRAEASRSRCQVLNPNVELMIDTDDLSKKETQYFEQFDLVILIDQKYSLVDKINKICRNSKIRSKPVIQEVGNLEGDIIVDGPSSSKKARMDDNCSDLDNGVKKENQITVEDDEQIKVVRHFPSWNEAWNVDWTQKKLIRKVRRLLPRAYFPIKALLRMADSEENVEIARFMEIWRQEIEKCNHILSDESVCEEQAYRFFGPQLSPACSIVGAQIAQEAVKALSQKDEPLRNVFLFSACETSGYVCLLPPNM